MDINRCLLPSIIKYYKNQIPKGEESLEDYISHKFLEAHGFKSKRSWSSSRNRYIVTYTISGYGNKIILSPIPQPAGMHYYKYISSGCTSKRDDITTLNIHSSDHWEVYLNRTRNHLTTFNFKWELLSFMAICGCPI